jgi:hypothetical protein
LRKGETTLKPTQEALDAFEGFFDLRQRSGITAAEVAFALLAEGSAGDDGHFLFLQEALGELIGGKAG